MSESKLCMINKEKIMCLKINFDFDFSDIKY